MSLKHSPRNRCTVGRYWATTPSKVKFIDLMIFSLLFVMDCGNLEAVSVRYLGTLPVLWIRNYFFSIRIRLFRKFRIRIQIGLRIRPNLSLRRQFFLCLRILDRPGLIFNVINLIGLIVSWL